MGGMWWGCARRVEAAARAKGRMRPSGWMRGAVLLSIVATSVGVKPLLIRPRGPTLSSTAVIQGPVFVPPTTLSSAIHKTEGVQNANMLVLLVSCAALIAAGSIVMLVFASLATHRSIPLRNFVAAASSLGEMPTLLNVTFARRLFVLTNKPGNGHPRRHRIKTESWYRMRWCLLPGLTDS